MQPHYDSITFQSNTADELRQLLETYHILDFYHGDSELEKICSLMEWVHKRFGGNAICLSVSTGTQCLWL